MGKINNKNRYIVIGNAKEGPRMKISKPGIPINSNTPYENYITLYINNGRINEKTNSKKQILKNKEKEKYKEMFKRNINILNLTLDKNYNIKDLENAFKNDEELYRTGKKYKRNKDGTLIIWDDNGIKHYYELNGKEII